MRYPLAFDATPQADLDALADWLRTGPWLTMGSLCREFEEKFAAWLGRKHAVFVNSGSSANWLMTMALKHYRPKIVSLQVPAIGWATTVSPAKVLGYDLAFKDVEAETWGMRALAYHGEAMLCVHTLGVSCVMGQLGDGILLEDACAALGSSVAGKKVGTFGTMASFSFYYAHQMSTIEGGMVVTDEEILADVLRLLRAHGWGADLPKNEPTWWKEHGRDRWDFDRKFTFYLPGMNVRPMEIQAFLGLRQLARIDELVARRSENDAHYRAKLGGSQFDLQRPAAGDLVCSIAVGVLAVSVEHRAKVAYALEQTGVETRPIGGGNLARQPFIGNSYQADQCPMADEIGRRGFQLPNTPNLTFEDIEFICDTILRVKA